MTQVERLYLDHAATTPVLPAAREAVDKALQRWANPSSPHADGRAARSALEQARRTVAGLLEWRHDVILTSGASEALAIVGARCGLTRHIVGATEHEAVAAGLGTDSSLLPVDRDGLADLDALQAMLAEGPALVAVQLANNETGVIQPIEAISDIVEEGGGLLLVDCAQTAGKIALPAADFIAISGHKFGAPPGIGALLIRDLASIQPSGGQEKGYRRGTENLPAAAGMAAALQSQAFANQMGRLELLRASLEQEIAAAGGSVIAGNAPRIPTIGAYSMPGVAGSAQLVQFDLAGISVSAGSACASGSLKSSKVLSAMGLDPEVAGTVIRVSFGPDTSESDVERFLRQWRSIRDRARPQAA